MPACMQLFTLLSLDVVQGKKYRVLSIFSYKYLFLTQIICM